MSYVERDALAKYMLPFIVATARNTLFLFALLLGCTMARSCGTSIPSSVQLDLVIPLKACAMRSVPDPSSVVHFEL